MKIEANMAISRLYGRQMDEYAHMEILHEIARKWLQGSAPALTLFRPAEVMRTTPEKGREDFRWIGGMGLTLDFMPTGEKDIKCLSLQTILEMCREFGSRHYKEPTHLLLPPQYYISFPREIYMTTVFRDNSASKAPHQFTMFGLEVVPNSPKLAVAIL